MFGMMSQTGGIFEEPSFTVMIFCKRWPAKERNLLHVLLLPKINTLDWCNSAKRKKGNLLCCFKSIRRGRKQKKILLETQICNKNTPCQHRNICKLNMVTSPVPIKNSQISAKIINSQQLVNHRPLMNESLDLKSYGKATDSESSDTT